MNKGTPWLLGNRRTYSQTGDLLRGPATDSVRVETQTKERIPRVVEELYQMLKICFRRMRVSQKLLPRSRKYIYHVSPGRSREEIKTSKCPQNFRIKLLQNQKPGLWKHFFPFFFFTSCSFIFSSPLSSEAFVCFVSLQGKNSVPFNLICKQDNNISPEATQDGGSLPR